MMTSKRTFIYDSLETLLTALIIGLLTVWAVKAEDKLDVGVLNGLFTPTQSERFFETGRKDFEREIEIFKYPERYLRDDLLRIDPELRDRINQDREQPDSQYNDLGSSQVYSSKLKIADF